MESHRIYRAGGRHRGTVGANDAGQTVPTNHGENFGGGLRFCRHHVRDPVGQVFNGGYSRIGDRASRIDTVRDPCVNRRFYYMTNCSSFGVR